MQEGREMMYLRRSCLGLMQSIWLQHGQEFCWKEEWIPRLERAVAEDLIEKHLPITEFVRFMIPKVADMLGRGWMLESRRVASCEGGGNLEVVLDF